MEFGAHVMTVMFNQRKRRGSAAAARARDFTEMSPSSMIARSPSDNSGKRKETTPSESDNSDSEGSSMNGCTWGPPVCVECVCERLRGGSVCGNPRL